MNTFTQAARRPSRLAPELAGKIVIPQYARFDEARRAWNLSVDQQPAAVVFPESAQDVATAVLFAAEWGQRIVAQGTGQGAATLGPLDDSIPHRRAAASDRAYASPVFLMECAAS